MAARRSLFLEQRLRSSWNWVSGFLLFFFIVFFFIAIVALVSGVTMVSGLKVCWGNVNCVSCTCGFSVFTKELVLIAEGGWVAEVVGLGSLRSRRGGGEAGLRWAEGQRG